MIIIYHFPLDQNKHIECSKNTLCEYICFHNVDFNKLWISIIKKQFTYDNHNCALDERVNLLNPYAYKSSYLKCYPIKKQHIDKAIDRVYGLHFWFILRKCTKVTYYFVHSTKVLFLIYLNYNDFTEPVL